MYDMTPKFHPERLLELNNLKDPSKIFVGSAADMFGSWVETNWFSQVLRVIYDNPQHIFQMLTKAPENFHHFFSCDESKIPDNVWLGVTIDAQKAVKRLQFLLDETLKKREHSIKFVSFEPLLEEIVVNLSGLDWIIIGANSNKGAPRPPMRWIDKLIHQARGLKIPVWVKDNYHYPEKIKEFPK
jgi:protein gp37